MTTNRNQTIIDIDVAIAVLDQRQFELEGGVDSVSKTQRNPTVVKNEESALGKLIVNLREIRETLLAA